MNKANTRYLIFRDASWISTTLPPKKIKGDIVIPTIKSGYDIDKRTKEYRSIMRAKPRFYYGISANVVIEK